MKKGKFLWKEFTFRSWWVIFLALLCGVIYEQSRKEQDTVSSELRQRLEELTNEKNKALQLQGDLKLQINSQSDHDWIELTLMKGLGVVPEDQIKVYFKEASSQDK